MNNHKADQAARLLESYIDTRLDDLISDIKAATNHDGFRTGSSTAWAQWAREMTDLREFLNNKGQKRI